MYSKRPFSLALRLTLWYAAIAGVSYQLLAQKLQADLDVPVGLMVGAVGGTLFFTASGAGTFESPRYEVKGRMLGGFAAVAYPAKYGVSGVMTFVVNHDGVVFEKDAHRSVFLPEVAEEQGWTIEETLEQLSERGIEEIDERLGGLLLEVGERLQRVVRDVGACRRHLRGPPVSQHESVNRAATD